MSADADDDIRLSLVIPTYNERHNIATLICELDALLGPVLGAGYELIVVDDDSPDRTWELALELAQTHPRVRVIRRCGERGLSTAVVRGWQVARGRILAVMDGDLQHPTDVNLRLLAEIERGADLATASRHVAGGGVSDWSAARRVLSRGAQLLGLLILPGVLSRLSDPMSGFFMLRRAAVADVTLDPSGYKILIEVVARGRVGWIGETGYVFRERVLGSSKVTASVYIDYLRQLLKLRWALLPSSRLLRFCLIGTSGVVVDMALLYLLSDPKMLGFGLTRSKLVAAEAAVIWNFLLNDAWTFGDIARQHPDLRARLRRFIGFNAVCAVGIGLNLVLLNLLFNVGKLNRYLANALAILAVTAWNYGINRKLNWSPLRIGTESRAASAPAGEADSGGASCLLGAPNEFEKSSVGE
jgi:dolichol-phosphate mannosyltransferase